MRNNSYRATSLCRRCRTSLSRSWRAEAPRWSWSPSSSWNLSSLVDAGDQWTNHWTISSCFSTSRLIYTLYRTLFFLYKNKSSLKPSQESLQKLFLQESRIIWWFKQGYCKVRLRFFFPEHWLKALSPAEPEPGFWATRSGSDFEGFLWTNVTKNDFSLIALLWNLWGKSQEKPLPDSSRPKASCE